MIGSCFSFHILYRVVMFTAKHFGGGKPGSEFDTTNGGNSEYNVR